MRNSALPLAADNTPPDVHSIEADIWINSVVMPAEPEFNEPAETFIHLNIDSRGLSAGEVDFHLSLAQWLELVTQVRKAVAA